MAETTDLTANATVGMIIELRTEITQLKQSAYDREANMGMEMAECTKAVEGYRNLIDQMEQQGTVQQGKIQELLSKENGNEKEVIQLKEDILKLKDELGANQIAIDGMVMSMEDMKKDS